VAIAFPGVVVISTSPIRAGTADDQIVDPKKANALVDAHDAAEVERLKAEQAKRKPNEVLFLINKPLSDDVKALADKKQFPPIVPIAAPPPDPCQAPQSFFVRRNGLDTFQLGGQAVPLPNAKGASVSFTQDDLNHSNNTAINARVQAVLYRYDPTSPCMNGKVTNPWPTVDLNSPQLGFAFAPFVDGQGSISSPLKKGEASALQTGVDLQVTIIGGPLFDHQYFTLTPYYQTDYRGVANVQGFTAFWDPIAPNINLGGRIGVPDQYADWFWQFRASYDERQVTNPGFTGLAKTKYQWVGSVAQVHITLFPDRDAIEPGWLSPFPALVDRLFVDGMVTYYWDADSGRSIHLYEAEVGYNITTDGKSSISVKYDNGTDKDTLQAMQKYLVSLNYKY
jgi:hypothetical protein